MADLKLFDIGTDPVRELVSDTYDVEKSLQHLIERHSEALLGIRILASEYRTGALHGGRMDTLAIDENNSPVIVEYKRSKNENVINQGLYYLDWLMDHQGEFKYEVSLRFGAEVAHAIEWSNPRLLCIASDFTKYDEHAVNQMNRNIELIRYRRYENRLLLFELVNAVSATAPIHTESSSEAPAKKYATINSLLEKATPEVLARFELLREYLLSFGDDVQEKQLKQYYAYKRLKNFACVEVRPNEGDLLAYVKVDPSTIQLEDGFTRDVTNIGHYGTGDLEIRISSDAELDRAKPLLESSYESS